ncbi:MAG: hypothetical protein GOVbin630_192 [Prokaryotic dsDNA virus sp.]|nr:MAG: hypothetical protein GOVbin630_192 [Prokaryotic dsDNA virus sp.]|tara:strand:+ start:5929 stop:6213 length:285 start_codon:yes stop_codon:yes gene_type:complete
MIKLIEVVPTHKHDFSLREVYINPDHVVFLREDTATKIKLQEQKIKFPEGLDARQVFTRLQIHNGTTGTEFIVVGAPHVIESKLKSSNKELLHG